MHFAHAVQSMSPLECQFRTCCLASIIPHHPGTVATPTIWRSPLYKLTQRCGAAISFFLSIHRGDSAQCDSPVQSTSTVEVQETDSELSPAFVIVYI